MKAITTRVSTTDRHSVRIASCALTAVLASVLFADTALAADAVDSAKLWSKNCQTCHGADGKGQTKAGEKAKVKDLTSAAVKTKLTKAKALESMKNGVKEEGSDKLAMKSYSEKLSAAEIDALADYAIAFK